MPVYWYCIGTTRLRSFLQAGQITTSSDLSPSFTVLHWPHTNAKYPSPDFSAASLHASMNVFFVTPSNTRSSSPLRPIFFKSFTTCPTSTFVESSPVLFLLGSG